MNIKINLMPWQIEILNDPHKVKVVIAGRQTGKSHMLQAGITKTCATMRGRSAVVMPVQPQSTDFFKLMLAGDGFESVLQAGDQGKKLWPYPQMNFRSGHYLEFRSFENPRRLRGGKWDGIVACDEANDLEGDEINRGILPKVSTTNAQVYITSTVTHHNWLWDLYLRGQGNDPMVKSWLLTSDKGYKFQGAEGLQRLADLQTITPAWIWNSEYLCIPSTDNSTAFPYWERVLIDPDPPEGPQKGKRYLIGLDLGRARDQEIAIVGDDEGLIVDMVEFPVGAKEGLEHAVMAQRVASLSRHWNNARVVIDSTGKGGAHAETDDHVQVYRDVLDDRLEEFFWSANRDNATKYDVISYLMLMIEQKRLRVPKKFRTLDAQMRQYRILKSKGTNSVFGPKPKSGHNDDAVAALAQYAWGRKKNWFADDGAGENLGSMIG